MTGRKQEIKLQNDFDAVVTYGGTTVELNADGTVILKIGGHSITYANGNVSNGNVSVKPPVIHNHEEKTKILDLAASEARKYGRATIGFNHLLAAIIKARPQEIADILGTKIKVTSLAAMLEKDMSTTRNHPQDLVPGSTFRFGPAAREAIESADMATQHWRTDRLFGAELLHSMLRAGKVDREERSTTLEYVDMCLSNYLILTAHNVYREAIDSYARTIGEALPQSRLSPPGLRAPC